MSLANGRFLQDKALQPLCQRLAGPGREHVFAGVESCGSPGNLPQRQLTARLLTDSEPSANGGKGRDPVAG